MISAGQKVINGDVKEISMWTNTLVNRYEYMIYIYRMIASASFSWNGLLVLFREYSWKLRYIESDVGISMIDDKHFFPIFIFYLRCDF